MEKNPNTRAERRVEKNEYSSTPAKSNPLNSYFLAARGGLNRVKLALKRREILILTVITGILFGFLPLSHLVKKAEAELAQEEIRGIAEELEEKLVFVQDNSLLAISDPSNPEPQVSRRILVVVTGYSSSPWETDDTPHLTAAGTWVRDGIIANNMLPFGTKIRVPDLYGDKVFVVEDRMNWVKGNYHVDIWFPSYWEALNFGAKTTYIEVLEG